MCPDPQVGAPFLVLTLATAISALQPPIPASRAIAVLLFAHPGLESPPGTRADPWNLSLAGVPCSEHGVAPALRPCLPCNLPRYTLYRSTRLSFAAVYPFVPCRYRTEGISQEWPGLGTFTAPFPPRDEPVTAAAAPQELLGKGPCREEAGKVSSRTHRHAQFFFFLCS